MNPFTSEAAKVFQHPGWLARHGGRPATKYGLPRKAVMKFVPRKANLAVVNGGWMDDRPIAALAEGTCGMMATVTPRIGLSTSQRRKERG